MPVLSHTQGPHTLGWPQALMHNALCFGLTSMSIQWSATHWA